MTSSEIEEHLAVVKHETRAIECKGAGKPSDKYFLAKIARAALSMANLRDGGHVIIGIADGDGELSVEGLSEEQVREWTDFDDISSKLSSYCDPPLKFDVDAVELSDGNTVVVLQLHCFTDIPHLCGKAYGAGKDEVLRQGALYVRSHRMPETSEIASHVEMREVLSIATQNALRSFVSTAHAAGLELHEQVSPDEPFAAEVLVDPSFDEGVSNSNRAYWDISIRPYPFDAHRIARGSLKDVIAKSTVRLRGWPVPYTDSVLDGSNFVGSDVDARVVPHEEQWRLFTSGQFIHRRIVSAEFTDTPHEIPVWEILFYLTEVLELAVRLTQSMEHTPPVVSVSANLVNMDGRRLVSGERARHLNGTYQTIAHELPARIEVPVADLLSDSKELAVQMATTIFEGFGFSPVSQVLTEYQMTNLFT